MGILVPNGPHHPEIFMFNQHQPTSTNTKSRYPLVNIQKTMENHHFSWENPLFLWSFSIAMLVYQRVSTLHVSNQPPASIIVQSPPPEVGPRLPQGPQKVGRRQQETILCPLIPKKWGLTKQNV